MDGVLMDSWDATNDAFLKMKFRGNTLEEVTANHIAYCMNKPWHSKSEKFSKEKYEYILGVMHTMYEIVIKDPRYVPFTAFLDELGKVPDSRFALVSSNGSKHVTNFISLTDIKFTHALSFVDGTSKEDKIEKITRDWDIGTNDFLYITDSLADVYELETFMPKKNIIGVAWGYCGYDVLAKELPPEQILKEFTDIHKVTALTNIIKNRNDISI